MLCVFVCVHLSRDDWWIWKAARKGRFLFHTKSRATAGIPISRDDWWILDTNIIPANGHFAANVLFGGDIRTKYRNWKPILPLILMIRQDSSAIWFEWVFTRRNRDKIEAKSHFAATGVLGTKLKKTHPAKGYLAWLFLLWYSVPPPPSSSIARIVV